MRVMVTGSDGYIGSLLAPYLIECGHEVVGVDTGYYRDAWLYNATDVRPWTLCKDIRALTAEDFEGIDAVVHMAELSNDPLSQFAEQATYAINHAGSLHVAATAKAMGVTRFVYTSSCSVYGAAAEDLVDEESPLRPQTTYAVCKQLVERDLSAMADDAFSPTFLRNATAFGASPRMRFDLVVNDLAGHAWTEKVIRMDSDGRPWRPFVHILDISQAIDCVLQAPRDAIHNEIYNVGSTALNYQIREIAEQISDAFPGCRLHVGDSTGDHRNYKVNFDKIHERLPGFAARHDVASGARQLLEVFRAVDMSTELFEFRGHTRIRQMQHLLETRQIDDRYFWIDPPRPTGEDEAGGKVRRGAAAAEAPGAIALPSS
jgi:nucleoside-diphosphate-sugar epimerase